jgi:hypothetical protein
VDVGPCRPSRDTLAPLEASTYPIRIAVRLSRQSVALTAAQAVIYQLARNGGLTVNGQSAFIL